jgi:hypothetical protein
LVSRPTFYGTVAVLVALSLVSSSVAVFYYYRYQEQASASGEYSSELRAALAKYDSLTSSFNSSLQDYRTSLSLLAEAVSNLNTTTPAYLNASRDLVSLWNSYRLLASVGGTRPAIYVVDLEVEYPAAGGSTNETHYVRWYNGTAVEPGWNGYVVTLALLSGRVQAVWYPQYQEHFVTGIDGVNSTGSTAWFVWEYQGAGWQAAPSGVDEIQIHNGTIMAWTLCGYDASFVPSCSP